MLFLDMEVDLTRKPPHRMSLIYMSYILSPVLAEKQNLSIL
jgi:hypothetical protein